MATYTIKPKEIKCVDDYEVIVVGGGPSGCAAGIAAARKGAKTLIIEATTALGGMGTMGLLPVWANFTDQEKIIHKGIAEEILNESKKGVLHMKDELDWVHIDNEYLKQVYDKLVTEAGCDILFQVALSMVDVENGKVNAIIVNTKIGPIAYRAKVYIDCTGDGDLAYFAGAQTIPLEEGDQLQGASHCFQISNVDSYAYRNEVDLDHSHPNSVLHDIFASGKYNLPDKHCWDAEAMPGTLSFNAGHIWTIDPEDPVTLSNAYIEGRRIAAEFHRAFSEMSPATFASSRLSATAPLMGIRESRRILGDYVLKAEDYWARREFDDSIGRNCYHIDVHSRQAIENIDAINSGEKAVEKPVENLRYQPGESHGIPYRCLTPKGLQNVLVAGRCVSCDRPVLGGIRVMPVCLTMGVAAGKAAALAKDMDIVDVHAVDVKTLRECIMEDGGLV